MKSKQHGLDRLPPQALGAEMAVLGSMIIDKDAIVSVKDIIKPEYLYSTAHNIIFKAIERLYNQDMGVDIVTLSQELKNAGELILAGGEAYLSDLASRVATTAHAPYYAKIVREKYFEREREKAILKLSTIDAKDVDRWSKGLKYIDDLTEKIVNFRKSKAVGISKAALDFISELEKKNNLVKIGYNRIDDICLFEKTDLMVIAGESSSGKSLFCINILRNMLEKGLKVLVCPTEMSPAQYVARIAVQETNIPMRKFIYRNFELEDYSNITGSMSELSKKNLFFLDKRNPDINDIEIEISNIKPDVVIVDNLTSVKKKGGNANFNLNVRDFVIDFKSILVNNDCLGILACHTNRAAEGKMPTKHNIADSSDIDKTADKIILLYQDKDKNPSDLLLNTITISYNIGKNRVSYMSGGDLILNRHNCIIREAV